MDWSTRFPAELTEHLGPLEMVGALSGSVWRVRGPAGELVWKRSAAAVDEAAGLRRLGSVEGVRVPAVVAAADDWLVTEWVGTGRRTERSDCELGRSLARLHSASAAEWGGGSSWIGNCRVDARAAPDGAEFYGRRLGELAARCGLDGELEPVIDRLDRLLPPGGPTVLHGDLWWGNVLFGTGDRPWLIDPSVHGGHPEEDLAMLALFGPVPDDLLAAYRELRPLESGWEERVGLFQLYPLLVHSVLFGGSYRDSVVAVAGRYR